MKERLQSLDKINWCGDIPYYEVNEAQNRTEKIIIFLHGFRSSTKDNIKPIRKLARLGFIVIGIDMRNHGIRSEKDNVSHNFDYSHRKKIKLLIDTCDDILKVIDHYIKTRDRNEQMSRIGILGVSMGGMISYYLATIDKRIAAIAPTISTPDWQAGMGLVKKIFELRSIRNINFINPAKNINKIFPTPIFIQNGKWDKVIPIKYTEKFMPNFKKYYNEAGNKFCYKLHDCGHELIDDMVSCAAYWFNRILE